MEAGRLIPTPEDADHYARALGAPTAVRRQLVAMARDLHEQHRASAPARVSVNRSAAAHEQRVRRNEARSTYISVFHPIVIPGLLQTEEYIRAIFASGGLLAVFSGLLSVMACMGLLSVMTCRRVWGW
jgi:hypothetical protein